MSNLYQATILNDSPIRYYRLNETSGTVAHDLGSQAQNGTLNGGITLNQSGLITGDTSGCMLFNGSTGYVSIPTTGLPTGNGSWSMECWMKVPGTLVSGDLMGFGATITTEIWFLQSLSTPAFSIRQWSGAQVNGGTPAINTKFYLAATYDGTTVRLYVNGSQVNTGTPTSNIVAGIAKIGNVSGSFFNGYIQEAAWYSSALSATQVTNHYNTGLATNPPLYTVATGQTISKLDVNQCINVLQQPAGGQEKGKYFLVGNAYISGGYVSVYMMSLSRNATPVSVSIDTTDQAASNLNAPAALNLTANGFRVHATSTGIATTCQVGGNYTVNY